MLERLIGIKTTLMKLIFRLFLNKNKKIAVRIKQFMRNSHKINVQ